MPSGPTGTVDAVDAALVCLTHDGDVVLTPDAEDLRLLAEQTGTHVDLVPVRTPPRGRALRATKPGLRTGRALPRRAGADGPELVAVAGLGDDAGDRIDTDTAPGAPAADELQVQRCLPPRRLDLWAVTPPAAVTALASAALCETSFGSRWSSSLPDAVVAVPGSGDGDDHRATWGSPCKAGGRSRR